MDPIGLRFEDDMDEMPRSMQVDPQSKTPYSDATQVTLTAFLSKNLESIWNIPYNPNPSKISKDFLLGEKSIKHH